MKRVAAALDVSLPGWADEAEVSFRTRTDNGEFAVCIELWGLPQTKARALRDALTDLICKRRGQDVG